MLLRDIFIGSLCDTSFAKWFFCSKLGSEKLFPFLKINAFGSNTESTQHVQTIAFIGIY